MENFLVLFSIFLSISILVFLTVKKKLHPFFALTICAFIFGILSRQSIPQIIEAYSSGLGSTISGIGVVIAIGTVMGALLEKSGAAESMAETILKITGKKNADFGLAVTGYFVSIPVFCDSAYVLLSPIAKRLCLDTKKSMTTIAVALAMGLHATHMLVPPTPGPLAVAGILKANLGLVILFGMLISIPVTIIAVLLGRYFGKKYNFISNESLNKIEIENKPTAFMSFFPIILPIILMLLKTISNLESFPLGKGYLYVILNTLGETIIALFIGLILSFYTYKSVYKNTDGVWSFDGLFGEALKTAGQIVLIVGAGGAFATVLKTSNLKEIITAHFSGFTFGILVPYFIGAIFRTAIGSGTVGMITAASMLAPLIDILGFNSPMGLVIAMLSCAAGGFMVFHGNDDFFWVVTSTSNMKPEIAYKVFPIISIAQSLVALVCILILKTIFL